MRASRLLTIQLLLETRGRMSAHALAAELEISVRTLYRDIDQLAATGVPIYAERGRGGGFQLLDGWKSTLTGLTTNEAQAIFMSGLAGPASQLGIGHAITDAQLKLLAALPPPQRQEAQRLQQRFHLDPVDWYRAIEPLPQLITVANAVWNDRQLHITYESWNGISEQQVHPLGLVLKSSTWYLVAALQQQPRTYRIANIQACTLLDHPIERPVGFDLATYWADSVQRFEQEIYQGTAIVLATPHGLRLLKRLNARVAAVVHHAPPPPADQRCQLSIPIEQIAHAAEQLLPLAPDVEVLAPEPLRQAICSRLQAMLDRYPLAKS